MGFGLEREVLVASFTDMVDTSHMTERQQLLCKKVDLLFETFEKLMNRALADDIHEYTLNVVARYRTHFIELVSDLDPLVPHCDLSELALRQIWLAYHNLMVHCANGNKRELAPVSRGLATTCLTIRQAIYLYDEEDGVACRIIREHARIDSSPDDEIPF